MPGKVIEYTHHTTAPDLLQHLSPLHDSWRSTGGLARWVFRGQAGEWPLSPSAMRDEAFTYDGIGATGRFTPANLEQQLREELRVVSDFARASIRAGLSLPEDSQWFRSDALQKATFSRTQLELSSKHGVDSPFPLLRSIFALAQHHLVPTRLLDWTGDPMIAAYFACKDVARWQVDPTLFPPQKTPTANLALWALRSAIVFDRMREHHERNRSFEPILEMVEAPYRDNPRLAAQKGAFTLVVYSTARKPDDFRLPPVEQVLRDYEVSKYGSSGTRDEWPLAHCLTLPHTEARALLRLLGEAAVNAATVYRDYEGARVSVEEVRYWK